VNGQWRYLYRAIDRNGALVDVMFSEHRDMVAAKSVLPIGQDSHRRHA
jgi:transposase-like protein